MLAWATGRWLDLSPLEQLHPTTAAFVAAVPLLLGLYWTLTTGTSSVRRLAVLVVKRLGPLLAPRVYDVVALNYVARLYRHQAGHPSGKSDEGAVK